MLAAVMIASADGVSVSEVIRRGREDLVLRLALPGALKIARESSG